MLEMLACALGALFVTLLTATIAAMRLQRAEAEDSLRESLESHSPPAPHLRSTLNRMIDDPDVFILDVIEEAERQACRENGC